MAGGGWTQEDLDRRFVGVTGAVAKLPPATGRIDKPEMNKTEFAYAQYLYALRNTGAVIWHQFESITIKLGHDCRLTPDFLVMFPDGHLELHDTKGAKKIKTGRKAGQTKAYVEEDALVKARVCAANFVIPVYFVWQEKNGEWSKREL